MPAPFSAASQQAVANAAGEATASIGPVPIGQRWKITRTSVQSSSVANTTATIYRSSALPANYIDSTTAGRGDSSDTQYTIQAGESVIVKWTGATVGAPCSFSIDGEAE